ncbi:MAG: isoprenylcysteine carboxylmethyltransferase family protein [Alphaproteobacteria bacterium]|nr:isoprenylcysteine carboxylmethyltransferase family protein [Alphaproteobacteria bacterium]MBV9371218.1 isoprenylcysteine carboxylmethyltransferase family protein [Alphaproteobacteria bacterium]MBV9899948.1 isoprenylcysteine carboxylmethyltransferase family protein [Alphaproteobacteria bacterium]
MLNDAAAPLSHLGAGSRQALLLDLAERAFVLVLVSTFLYRLVPGVSDSPTNLLIMVSEGLTALMILIRRPGPAMNTGYGWAIAIIGTCAPLLVVPEGPEWISPATAIGLMSFGLLCSISAKIFLRRSFGIVPANRGVQREGPYRVVRHPIYFGYLLAQIGFFCVNVSVINAVVYAACWLAMVLRIRAEEEMLGLDPSYAEYQQAVRYRLIPFVW